MTSSILSQRAIENERLLPTLSLTALVVTILLILVGSIVRVTGNGLGCPDWPLCYGQAIPPALTGAWVEFSHRLFGGAASLLIVSVGALAWRNYSERKWIFRPAMIAIGLLVVQVGLGGLHVIMEIPPETGLLHTGIAMIIVGLIAVVAANASPAAREMQTAGAKLFQDNRFVGLVSTTAIALYFLLMTGSLVTRSGASLVCPFWPACGAHAEALSWMVNAHLLHRYTAYTIGILTLMIAGWMFRQRAKGIFNRFATTLIVLLTLQISLGIGNVLLRIPMWTRALHLTVGATFWVAIVALWTIVMTQRTGQTESIDV